MMQTREIPHDEWVKFFSDCSERHRGEPVTIEAIGGSMDGVQAQAFEMPLVGIAPHQSDTGDHIEVLAGENEPVRHVVDRPTHVKVFEDGSSAMIEIDAPDGRSTRLRFGGCGKALPPGEIC